MEPGGAFIYHQGLQYLFGPNLTQDFAEDAQFLLGPCATSTINGGLIPTETCVETAASNGSQLTFHDHHATIGDDNAASVSCLEASSSTSMTDHQSTLDTVPLTPVVHASLQSTGPTALACPHGCRGTFGRPGEYRRHMGKHANHSFFCTQLSCTKSFYRKDKLKDHLRQGHGIAQSRRARGAAVIGAANVASATGDQV